MPGVFEVADATALWPGLPDSKVEKHWNITPKAHVPKFSAEAQ